MKNLPFLSPIEGNELHDLIRQEAVQIAESNRSAVDEIEIETDSAAEMPPSTKNAKGEWELFELISDVMHTKSDVSQPTLSLQQKSVAEVAMYLSEPEVAENPLLWWKLNSFWYPMLSTLGKKYLAIPATSVPSERAFSAAGHIVNKKRACLQPSSVNMVVFLSENLS